MISDAEIVLNLVPKCVNTSIKLHQRNMAQKSDGWPLLVRQVGEVEEVEGEDGLI